MKKIILILVFAAVATVGLVAQTNTFPSTGNAGIGTTTPSYDLEIQSSSGAADMLLQRGSNWLRPIVGAGGGGMYFYRNSYFVFSPAKNQTDGNPIKSTSLYIYGDQHSTYPGQMTFGTATPGDNSKFTVAGRIRSEEVQVVNDVEAPDYVFASDYQLRSLDEVETFIQENKHLPEIPSAAEFCENGVMLGEMSFDLLKKVEELTLYFIQLNKKIENLEAELGKK
jgi:hypothetical protein